MSEYFDVDSILAEEERVPTTFGTDAFRVGYLDPSDEEMDIKAGTNVELPLWLSAELARRHIVSCDFPRSISAATREALAADPTVVRLRDRSPAFYRVGLALAGVSDHPDAPNLPPLLRAALAARCTLVMDTAHNSLGEDVSDFVNSLTNFEQAVFSAGYAAAKELAAWRRRDTTRLRMSSVAVAAGLGGRAALAAAAADVAQVGAAAKASGIKRKRNTMRV